MNPGYDDLQVSYGRCLRDPRFIERFYEILLAADPRIPALFAHTDFRQQRLALRRGISIAIAWASGSGMVRRSMAEMTDVHARGGRAPVAPGFYACWVDSLLRAVRESDPAWTPALEARWREAMGKVTAAFIERY